MPNLDRTGPKGQGPQTGRKQGRCGNNQNNASPKNNIHPRGKRAKDGSGAGKNLNRNNNQK